MTPFDTVLFLMGVENMLIDWYENDTEWTFHYTFTKNDVIHNFSTTVNHTSITDERVNHERIIQRDLLNYFEYHFKVYRFFKSVDFTDYPFPTEPKRL